MWARTAAFILLSVSCIWAGGGFFQRAAVSSMQVADCISTHRSLVAAIAGAPDTRRELCAEYVLVSATTIFRVQAGKSAPLLLPPEEISFRAGKGALVVRRDDHQDEFEVRVLCMQLRGSKQETCATVDPPATLTAGNSR